MDQRTDYGIQQGANEKEELLATSQSNAISKNIPLDAGVTRDGSSELEAGLVLVKNASTGRYEPWVEGDADLGDETTAVILKVPIDLDIYNDPNDADQAVEAPAYITGVFKKSAIDVDANFDWSVVKMVKFWPQ